MTLLRRTITPLVVPTAPPRKHRRQGANSIWISYRFNSDHFQVGGKGVTCVSSHSPHAVLKMTLKN